ncbi:UNKNOWN [Stylonychia lemnae]|uniref:Uncharacterized protein n=1 Tax=Stylonychia lemnae TaxID=5949 RepID=A0A077ZS48_STYLE|nr:UNKNOWN [Stylonychia lemnae]|eukprot:CDW72304.1 UNKNOWN [Stylonychia lemnae]
MTKSSLSLEKFFDEIKQKRNSRLSKNNSKYISKQGNLIEKIESQQKINASLRNQLKELNTNKNYQKSNIQGDVYANTNNGIQIISLTQNRFNTIDHNQEEMYEVLKNHNSQIANQRNIDYFEQDQKGINKTDIHDRFKQSEEALVSLKRKIFNAKGIKFGTQQRNFDPKKYGQITKAFEIIKFCS